ncbi:hypothetical protein ANTPLA_LOCUS1005 [Anthophora plagiata]
MFEMLTFNVDKFVHTFIQNLGFKKESNVCKKFSNIGFISHIDKPYKIKQLLFYSLEKMREVNVQENLDFSNEKHLKYFIEKHFNFFDKLIYFNNTQILTSYLKNINAKILQNIRIKVRNNENITKAEVKMHDENVMYKKKLRINLANKSGGLKDNSQSPMAHGETYVKSHNYERKRCKKAATSDIPVSNRQRDNSNLETDNNKQNNFDRLNFANSMANITKKEIEMAEKFMWLYIKDIEYIKRNIQVTLHIEKNLKYNSDRQGQIEYIQAFCHHAILCLIEPSEKGFVLVEDDLTVVIQKYLLHGYKYHFEFHRDSKNYYTALLVLSQWAKVLVKSMNTTMMHTICCILGCDEQNILVLYGPEQKLF